MPLFEIKRRYTGEVIYSCEALSLRECVELAVQDGANLVGAYLRGAYLRGANLGDANLVDANLVDANLVGANLCGANLVDANLVGANLCGANLVGAYLVGAYLRGANLVGDIKIRETPIIISTPNYACTIYDSHMQIGCKFYPLADWWSFEDRDILEMDGRAALEFWRKWKGPLQAICKAGGRE